jgi:hypothetical protein
MTNNPQLESYLEALHKALGKVPVSERADIITEIKSHILEAQERDPNTSLAKILSSLGDPQTVANRYLLERGLKPGKAPRAPIVKWLTVGFLGTFALICLTFIALIWRFTPLISVDEKSQHVVLLGGTIDVHGDTGNIRIGTKTFTDKDGANNNGSSGKTVTGSEDVDTKKVTKVQIPFDDGKVTVRPSTDNRLHWSCKVSKNAPEETSTVADMFKFNFGPLISCDFQIPGNMKPMIRGQNGKIVIEKMHADLDLNLVNGKVEFDPAPDAQYKYNFNVRRGMIGDFDSSSDPKAFVINMVIDNGKIAR